MSEEAQNSGTGASLMDPDAIMALLYAVVLEALDFLPVIGSSASLILGIPLIAWMVWKSGKISSAQEAFGRRSDALAKRAVKRAGRRALGRGAVSYVIEGIPLVSTFTPLWIVSVVLTVLQKPSKE